jgi:hypothetical protein
MMSRGFKPVGWVASVAGAALGCYMLSLNVASERAELAKLERSIIMAKKDIRSLETELGTRGRLQQLESWNSNVLALSAPTSAQYLDNAMTLARFDQREPTLEDRSSVQLASADTSAPTAPQAAPQAPIRYAAAPSAPQKPAQSLVHRASFSIPEAAPTLQPKKLAETKPAITAAKAEAVQKSVKAEKKAEAEPKLASVAKKPSVESKAAASKGAFIDDKLIGDIKDAAKAEKSRSAGDQ